MKRVSFFPFFLFLLIFIFNIIFFSCFSTKDEYEELKKEYILHIGDINMPSLIREKSRFRIGMKLYWLDPLINWTICLASFEPPSFEFGKKDASKCVEGYSNDFTEILEISLPKDTYIILKNKEYLLSDYVDVVLNFCYDHYILVGMEGCLKFDFPCTFSIKEKFPRDSLIEIEEARAMYVEEENENYYIIRFYLSIPYLENVYVLSSNENIFGENCYLRNFGNIINLTCTLNYANKNISKNFSVRPFEKNIIEFKIDDLKTEIPNIFVQLRCNYKVLKKETIGSIRISE